MLSRLTRDWEGETVFVIAGGPSVTQADVDRLRGQRVVVINSSYLKAPWADALMFTDRRWFTQHQHRVRETFDGEIVTLTPYYRMYDGLTVLYRQRGAGLSSDPSRLAWFHTSLTSAINMIVLRGARRICILGLDGEGGWHHEPHPEQWGVNKSKFGFHAEALEALVNPLKNIGVHVYNLNMNSKHTMFTLMSLSNFMLYWHGTVFAEAM